jgi:anti-anti-sigma factor
MTALARVDIERQQDSVVARVQGEVDASNAASLQTDIIAAIPNTTAGLVLELSEVDYMDSSGIRMLFLLHNQLEQRGQHLRAVVPDTTPIKHVLDCLGVGTLIPLDAKLSAALEQLARQ